MGVAANHQNHTKTIAICFVWVCLLALLLPQPLAAQPTPPNRATYELWLREAFAAAQRGDLIGLTQAAERLTPVRAIRLPAGDTVPVNNEWLRKALEVNTPDLEAIANRLGALIDALNRPVTAPPAEATTWLRTTLDNPPFSHPPQQASLIGRFLDWLLRQFLRLFEPINSAASGPASVISQVFALVGGILVIGLIIYWVLGLRRSMVGDVRLAPTHDPDANLTANSALQQATLLARDGDYRTAVRYLYLSALLWLDERGRLRYDRSLTNHEYLERLRDNPPLRTALLPVVETFDRVWYGHMPLDASSFAAYRQQVEALRSLTEPREEG